MQIKRKYLFGTTILAGVMAASAPAFAQNAQLPGVNVQGQSTQEATQIEEVVVTGSRIRRDPTNAPTPLIQVPREELLSTGQSTVIDYLATIPALANSVVPSDTTGSNLNDGGLSLPNLRSLGSGRTLTLIDGRRQVGSSGGSLAVDIDTIPRLMIENIEIVTGGASSVYGADAVSGVLNFVLRKDFEGAEIDANYGQINQGGQANKRVSALFGANLMDDRLNVWAFAEYEDIDEVQIRDIDWYEESWGLSGVDADPAAGSPNGPASDGIYDNALFNHRQTLQLLRWGQTTVANSQQPSMLSDPDIPFATCSGISFSTLLNGNCYAVNPGKTWVFEGTTARLADFGQRIGATGLNRTVNVGGDGENAATFGQFTRVPESTSSRFAAGINFEIAPNIRFSADAKYVDEETFDIGQPTFFDAYISNLIAANDVDNGLASSAFLLRLNDTAYLPSNLRTAIQTNTVTNYNAPTLNAPGTVNSTTAVPFARHTLWGPDRSQTNYRTLERYTAALDGDLDQLLFVNNFNWNLSYTYGKVEVENIERGVDFQRFQLAADAVVDTAGVVNGHPGEIVCRAKLLQAQNPANFLLDSFRDYPNNDLRDTPQGTASLNACVPMNVFGKGNQSQEALNYIYAEISPTEMNEQEQAIAYVSGELWDFFGAGRIGVAVGAEHRREYTEAVGRDADTAGRLLFLNTGADFPGAEYTSDEWFAELSIPLFRDSWLGEYAELSGSYRSFDYSTAGSGDVYGVNFVYRPVHDIAFKTSFNTSFRAPNLGENFSPYTQTFANGFVDPCATTVIQGIGNTTDRTNRINNCTALAAQKGLTYDFSGTGTPLDTTDDYAPFYASGIAGVSGGNPFLRPETSESFTFSTVIQPRWFPNLTLVLDYYEIEINDVIASVSAQTAATNCVNGSTLNQAACDTIFRNIAPVVGAVTAQQRSEGFKVGAPNGDPIGGFIQGSINYAALKTRGLDFTGRYSLDTEEAFGHNWGRFDYSIRGLWLIEQKQFLDPANASNFTELASGTNFPRVRFTSSLTWAPNDTWSLNWSVDWQTAQDIVQIRDLVANADNRPLQYQNTGDFARHDFTIRYNVNDKLTLRGGVVNAFDAEQAKWLGTTLLDNNDPYGTRFFIGLNYRPF